MLICTHYERTLAVVVQREIVAVVGLESHLFKLLSVVYHPVAIASLLIPRGDSFD